MSGRSNLLRLDILPAPCDALFLLQDGLTASRRFLGLAPPIDSLCANSSGDKHESSDFLPPLMRSSGCMPDTFDLDEAEDASLLLCDTSSLRLAGFCVMLVVDRLAVTVAVAPCPSSFLIRSTWMELNFKLKVFTFSGWFSEKCGRPREDAVNLQRDDNLVQREVSTSQSDPTRRGNTRADFST